MDLQSRWHVAERWQQSTGEMRRPALAQANIDRTLKLGAYRASTLVDSERGQPLELESLFLEPLRQAQAAGVATPRLARLGQVLQALDAGATSGTMS